MAKTIAKPVEVVITEQMVDELVTKQVGLQINF